jgi:hypothetical protein
LINSLLDFNKINSFISSGYSGARLNRPVCSSCRPS